METQEKFTKLLNTDIIAVEVPKTAESIVNIEWGKILYFEAPGQFPKQKEIDLGFDFELLGEATEDSISFDVEPYVKSIPSIFGSGHRDYYDYCFIKRDITKTAYRFTDKNESFRSLLQASGLNCVNPFSNKCKRETPPSKDFEHLKQWQEAESKRIKGKLIILKPIS